MTTTIEVQSQSLEVADIGDLVITNIVQDEVVGDYVRDIRVLNQSGGLAVQLRLRSTTKDPLLVSGPANEW